MSTKEERKRKDREERKGKREGGEEGKEGGRRGRREGGREGGREERKWVEGRRKVNVEKSREDGDRRRSLSVPEPSIKKSNRDYSSSTLFCVWVGVSSCFAAFVI